MLFILGLLCVLGLMNWFWARRKWPFKKIWDAFWVFPRW